ncbi:MAG: acyl carrier protein, partial [Clostridia bacterium]|nr:acyl carrier protein [Clostridia bacterium]
MVFDTIKKLLADQLDIDEEEITMESTLLEDLGADSIELVDLIMSVEEE